MNHFTEKEIKIGFKQIIAMILVLLMLLEAIPINAAHAIELEPVITETQGETNTSENKPDGNTDPPIENKGDKDSSKEEDKVVTDSEKNPNTNAENKDKNQDTAEVENVVRDTMTLTSSQAATYAAKPGWEINTPYEVHPNECHAKGAYEDGYKIIDGFEIAKAATDMADNIIYINNQVGQTNSAGHRMVDCIGLVGAAMLDVFGEEVRQNPADSVNMGSNMTGIRADIVDDNGNVIKPNINATFGNFAQAGLYFQQRGMGPGTRIRIQGNGKRIYYRCYAGGSFYLSAGNSWRSKLADGPNGRSSLIAWAYQYPGAYSIRAGHATMGLGTFYSAEDMLATYPNVRNRSLTGSGNTTANELMYSHVASEETWGYNHEDVLTQNYIGKTWNIEIGNSKRGTRVTNIVNDSYLSYNGDSCFAVMVPEPAPGGSSGGGGGHVDPDPEPNPNPGGGGSGGGGDNTPTKHTVIVKEYDLYTREEVFGTSYQLLKDGYPCSDYPDGILLDGSNTQLHLPAGNYTLVEKLPASGYVSNDDDISFSVPQQSQVNISKRKQILLTVHNTDADGNPLENVKYQLTYNNLSWEQSSDSSGNVYFDFTQDSIPHATLTELSVPDGFTSSIYKNGKSIDVNSGTIEPYGIKFKINLEASHQIDRAKYGNLTIRHKDYSRTDNAYMKNVQYGVFTNSNCSIPATDINRKDIGNVSSNSTELRIEGIPVGPKYITQVYPVEGYAIQPDSYELIIEESTTATPNEYTYEKGSKRQEVEIQLTITDEKGAAVPDVVYKLETASEIIEGTTGKTIPAGTLVGYFKSNSDGLLTANTIGTEAFSVAGKQYQEVAVQGIKGVPLMNGSYVLTLIYADPSVVLSTEPIPVEAAWAVNMTDRSKIVNKNTMVTQYGDKLEITLRNNVKSTQLAFGKYENQETFVPGAKVQILDENGEVFFFNGEECTWVMDKPIYLPGFPGYGVTNRTFKIHEVSPAPGFATEPDKEFTLLDNETTEVLLDSHPVMLSVEVQDTKNAPLQGVTMQLIDPETGSVVRIGRSPVRWVTNDQPYTIEYAPIGHYILREYAVPQGYIAADHEIDILDTKDTQKFVIKPSGIVSTFEINDENGKPLVGATAQITDIKGNVIELNGDPCTWTVSEKAHEISGLPKGQCDIVIEAFDGYVTTKNRITIVESNEKQTFTATPKPSNVVVYKADTHRHDLAGVEMMICQKGSNEPYVLNGVPCTWTSDGKQEGKSFSKLPLGEYVLVDTKTAPGFVPTTMDFIVTDTAEPQNVVSEAKDIIVTVSVIGKDGKHLSGVTIKLLDEKGTPVQFNGEEYQFTTGYAPTEIRQMPAGKYILKQISMPSGYAPGEMAITVQAIEDVQEIKFDSSENSVKFKITNHKDETLIGAQVVLTDKFNKPIEIPGQECSWKVTSDEHSIRGLPVGTYRIQAETVPTGYVENFFEFQITRENPNPVITLKNYPIVLSVNVNGLNGAAKNVHMYLTNEQDEVINLNGHNCDWVTDGTAKIFEMLPEGTYKLKAMEVPDGYSQSEETIVVTKTSDTQTVDFQLQANGTTIHLKDENGKYLMNAELELINSDGNTKATWTTKNAPESLVGLTSGSYTLKSTKMPAGYLPLEVKIDILQGKSQAFEVNAPYTQIRLGIVNQDGSQAEGVRMKLTDTNGTVIKLNGTPCDWIAGKEPKDYIKLQPGEYILTIVKAQNGFAAASAKITVKETQDIQSFNLHNTALNLEVSYEDVETNAYLTGGEFMLLDAFKNQVSIDGEPVRWISTEKPFTVSGINAGFYYLKQISAAPGYVMNAEDLKFEVKESGGGVKIKQTNAKLQGVLSISKTDPINKTPIQGAEFDIVSVEEVKDPLTSNVIYTKGQVVTTLKTNSEGQASVAQPLPIGTFDHNGMVATIKYVLKETNPGSGEKIKDIPFEFGLDGAEGSLIRVNMDLTKTEAEIAITRNNITYVGPESDKKNMTIVKNGDELTFEIIATNKGTVPANNIVLLDYIPKDTIIVKNENADFVYDNANNVVYKAIKTLKAGETQKLSFKVKVNTNESKIILDNPYYAMASDKQMDNIVGDQTINWISTDPMIFQSMKIQNNNIEGTTEKPLDVLEGEAITYELTIDTMFDIENVSIKDIIANGLTYVADSGRIIKVAKMRAAVADPYENVKATYNPDTKELSFDNFTLSAGRTIVQFQAEVDDIGKGQNEMVFENQFTVSYKDPFTQQQAELLKTPKTYHKLKYDFNIAQTADVATFTGDIKENVNLKDITVLKANDKVVYTITAENKGATPINDLKIFDTIPMGMTFVTTNGPRYIEHTQNKEKNENCWTLGTLNAQSSVSFTVTYQVADQKAALINHGISYTNAKNKEPVEAGTITYQVAEIQKSATVNGKPNNIVQVGDKINYMINVNTAAEINNITLVDNVPDGLKVFADSIMIKQGEEWTQAGALASVDNEANTITINVESLPAGNYYVKYDVSVDTISQNTEKVFASKAKMTYNKGSALPEVQEYIESQNVEHMTEIKITGIENGEKSTYVGPYEARRNITVVSNGDVLTYQIGIKNSGMTTLKNVVVKNTIPEGTKIVSMGNGQDDGKGTIYWILKQIAPEETVDITLKVKCETDKAMELRNKTYFAVPADIQNVKPEEWMTTDEVIYQTISVNHDASIEYGNSQETAKYLNIGQTYQYKLTISAKDTIYGVHVAEQLPKYLAFVSGTAKVISPNGISKTVVPSELDGYVTFPLLGQCDAGDTTFEVTVKVQDVPETEKDYFIENKWFYDILPNQGAAKAIESSIGGVFSKIYKEKDTNPDPELPEHIHEYEDTIVPPGCIEGGYTLHKCKTCPHSYKDTFVAPLGHKYGDWVVIKKATEKEDGLRRQTCERCGKTLDQVIPKLTHKHEFIKIKTVAPTCTEDGYDLWQCSCGTTEKRNIVPSKGHSWGEWKVVKAATETEAGEEKSTCSVCGATKTRVIPAIGHTHNYKKTVTAPTCMEQGYTTYTCSCGYSYVTDYVKALGHDWGEWKLTKPATETSDGQETQTCQRCGEIQTRRIPKLPHTHVYEQTVVKPTCTTDGYTINKCACGHSYISDKIPAFGHEWSQWKVVKDPTETTKGVEERVCAVCGEKETREISKLPHTHKYTEKVVEPTCTARGYVLHTCSCGDSYKSNYTAPLGHDWSDWTTTKDPTETEYGEKQRTCSRCGEIQTEQINKLPHKHHYTETVVAPTCTEQGYTLFNCECGHSYKADYVSATGHKWSAWEVTKEPTETAKGEEIRTCSVCGEKETRFIDVMPHKHNYVDKVIAPTCTEEGYTLHTCECGNSYKSDYVPATGHKYEVESVKDATCTEPERTHYVCSACGAEKWEDTATALGHDWSDWTVTKEPTVDAEGEETRTCNRCGETETRPVQKLDPEIPPVDPDPDKPTPNPDPDPDKPNPGPDPDPDKPKPDPDPEKPEHEHKYTTKVVAPTCTEDGYTLHTCECGDSYKSDVVPATGHVWEKWEVVKLPTVEEEGMEERVCSVCGEKETRVLPKLEPEIPDPDPDPDPEKPEHKHEYKKEVVKPTCTEDGYTVYTCECGDQYRADIVPATGHDWSSWKVIAKPTSTKYGTEERVCDNCGEVEHRNIPKLDSDNDDKKPENNKPEDPKLGFEGTSEMAQWTFIALLSIAATMFISMVSFKKKRK